jgi:hypothetical protein
VEEVGREVAALPSVARGGGKTQGAPVAKDGWIGAGIAGFGFAIAIAVGGGVFWLVKGAVQGKPSAVATTNATVTGKTSAPEIGEDEEEASKPKPKKKKGEKKKPPAETTAEEEDAAAPAAPPEAESDDDESAAPDAKIHAADPKHVDVAELFTQARAHAIARDPRVVFTDVTIKNFAEDGSLDLTTSGGAEARFTFEYAGLDPKKPPGADTVELGVFVTAAKGLFKTTSWDSSFAFGKNALALPMPESDPFTGFGKCGNAAAWKTIVASGVPAATVADLHFRRYKQPIWSILVKGHDELGRKVPFGTCKAAAW